MIYGYSKKTKTDAYIKGMLHGKNRKKRKIRH